VDDSAVISSANLTEDAFSRNMEMGVLIRGGDVPDRLWTQFSALLAKGELKQADS
jgi:cardiolipin synthase